MKTILAVALLLAAAVPVHAQYVIPARDLQDAARLVGEYGNAMKPAVVQARQEADALDALALAYRQLLFEHQPSQAVDKADRTLEEFVHREEASNTPLSKDILRYINLTRGWLSEAKAVPPTDLTALRERIHHTVLHPMQQRVTRNNIQIQDILVRLAQMSAQLQARVGQALKSVGDASPETTTP